MVPDMVGADKHQPSCVEFVLRLLGDKLPPVFVLILKML